MSTAELGRGIWGKGMEGDELAAGRAGRPCHGKNLRGARGFRPAGIPARSGRAPAEVREIPSAPALMLLLRPGTGHAPAARLRLSCFRRWSGRPLNSGGISWAVRLLASSVRQVSFLHYVSLRTHLFTGDI